MLTSLVVKYVIYFKEQAKRRSVHANGYCDTELNFGTDCYIGLLYRTINVSKFISKFKKAMKPMRIQQIQIHA